MGGPSFTTGGIASALVTLRLVQRAEATRLFGYPSVPLGKLVDWTADWVARGMPTLGKDTHYDVRDGVF